MATNPNGGTAMLDAVRELVDEADAGKVFGTPIVQNGLIVLPVAKISGGAGGGGGTGPTEDAGGSGGGVGLSAKPAGVYVIRNEQVSWRPAIDVNRVIMGGQLAAVVALLTIRAFIKARCRDTGSTS
jgi:uncharacterized spore protein YtfJ